MKATARSAAAGEKPSPINASMSGPSRRSGWRAIASATRLTSKPHRRIRNTRTL
jgi:hypothetical protein